MDMDAVKEGKVGGERIGSQMEACKVVSVGAVMSLPRTCDASEGTEYLLVRTHTHCKRYRSTVRVGFQGHHQTLAEKLCPSRALLFQSSCRTDSNTLTTRDNSLPWKLELMATPCPSLATQEAPARCNGRRTKSLETRCLNGYGSM